MEADVLALLETIRDELSMTKERVTELTGTDLEANSQQSNPHFDNLVGRGGPYFDRVELRLRKGDSQDHMLILELKSQPCFRREAVLERMGRGARPKAPSPHGPPDGPVYWERDTIRGVVRLGFDRNEPHCLVSVVLDRI